MRALKKTSAPDCTTRCVPWSTRAVILLAFAIQLVPVSERLSVPGARAGDRLVLSDTRLMALWLSDGVAKQAARATETALGPGAQRDEPRPPADWNLGAPRPGLDRFTCGLLPTPPPSAA